MHPLLFEIGGVKVHSYGFFVALGYVAALALLSLLARWRNLDPARFLDLAFLSLLTGVIGGRILFVLTNFAYFHRYPAEIFTFWQGGLVFYGGFLAAAGACWLYMRWKHMPLATLDVLAPGLAIGHAIGRIGCLAAGCCYGSYCEYPWGIKLDSDMVDPALRSLPLHPTQLYEAFSLFALTGLLVWLFRGRRLRDGGVALVYVMGYALIRSAIEIFRGDSIRGFVIGNWLSTSQLIAALLFLGCAYLLRRRLGRNH